MFGRKQGKGKSNVLDLGNSDSEGEGGFGNANELKINTNYADRYNKWRGSEELQKLKDRYGDQLPEDDESSSSSSEEEWTEDKEKAFFKTFSLLKKKDPKIYDSSVYFFNNSTGEASAKETESAEATAQSSSTKGKQEKSKIFSLKDHERKMILEKEGLLSDSDSGDDEASKKKNSDPSYVQQQENIKKGFSEALKTIDSEDEGDDYKKSDLLKPRTKSEVEKKQDDEDYRRWLKGEQVKLEASGSSKNLSKELRFLRDYWSDPNLNEGEKFLRDYILNRKYQEPDDKNHIPSYDEIVHDSDEEGLSGDEQQVEKMEEFEHKYNFRFEEPDQEFIKRYPRTVETSLRRADEKRKKQRETAKERKEAEKEKKREEIQRLKALKREEILEKLKQLQEITGDPNLAFDDDDVEGDFDPEAHDAKMQKMFNEQYYEEDEAAEKPVFPYDEELDGEWKAFCPSDEESESDSDAEAETPEKNEKQSKKKSKKKQNSKESKDTLDNDDKIPGPSSSSKARMSVIDELIEASKGKRQNSKKKSIFLQALERSKPTFDSKVHQSFQEYFDEYYQLDFEDLIGDIPCRFKYRKVTPNDFGLTTEEILKVPDRELNQWASVKKMYQYRTPEEEKYDVQAYRQKATNERQKKKILPTLFYNENDEERDENDDDPEATPVDASAPPETSSKKKNKKKKKKKKKSKAQGDQTGIDSMEIDESADIAVSDDKSEPTLDIPTSSEPKSKNQKNKKRKSKDQNSDGTANGNANDECSINVEESQPQPQTDTAVEGKSKKKKKKSKSADESTAVSTTPDSNTKSSRVEIAAEEQNGNSRSNSKKRKHPEDPQADQKNKKDGKKKWKDSSKNQNSNSNSLIVDDERLRAYGINPTKYKKQLKYGNKTK